MPFQLSCMGALHHGDAYVCEARAQDAVWQIVQELHQRDPTTLAVRVRPYAAPMLSR
ncbi:MAG: hypothetical protein ABI822_19395 [Bryobacteraceae bacterium]